MAAIDVEHVHPPKFALRDDCIDRAGTEFNNACGIKALATNSAHYCKRYRISQESPVRVSILFVQLGNYFAQIFLNYPKLLNLLLSCKRSELIDDAAEGRETCMLIGRNSKDEPARLPFDGNMIAHMPDSLIASGAGTEVQRTLF